MIREMNWRCLPVVDTLLMSWHIARYQLTFRRQAWCASASVPISRARERYMAFFISSFNTFAPFQLTIRTMLSHAAYPDLHVIVGDNNSRPYRLGRGLLAPARLLQKLLRGFR